MRVRKIDIQGFKSFADRTTFHFGKGIAGVVGPNGCGKSNIVDAVKWCIGEQSAKSLRGDAMADVIFAGSAARPAQNLAEVGITLVADGTPFPGIWERLAEIEVTRRLFRDGHSEYLINQERVRLRDVNDLFLDTGIGNQMYSFIEQGRIGQIVHARPEQRRLLIEEAAGITRFRARREETIERMTATRGELTKVKDRADEMGRQLKAAERSLQRILKFRALQAKIRQEEVASSLARFTQLIAERRSLSEASRVAASALAEATRAVQRHETELATRRTRMEESDNAANISRDRLGELEAQRRVEESAFSYQGKEEDSAKARVEKLKLETVEQQQELERANADAAQLHGERERAEAVLEGAKNQVEAAAMAAAALIEQTRQARARLETQRRQAQAGFEAAIRARTGRQSAETRRADLSARAEALDRAAADALGSQAGLEREIEKIKLVISARAEELEGGRKALEGARHALGTAEAERDQRVRDERKVEQELTEATRDRERVKARLDALEDMQRRNVDLPDGVRSALAVPGVHGLLSQKLDVPQPVEADLVRALEGSLETVLVPDVSGAVRVAAAAKGSRVRVLVVPEEAPPLTGLAETVGGTAEGKRALATLLPASGVAEDVSAAYARWHPGETIVAGAGALLRPDGVLVIGAQSDGAAGAAALKRRREIRELREGLGTQDVRLRALRTVLDRCRENHQTAEQAVLAARHAIGPANAELRVREAALTEARHRLKELEGDHGRTVRAGETARAEVRTLLAGRDALIAEEQRLSTGLAEAEARQATAEDEARGATAEIERLEPEQTQAVERAQRLRSEALAGQKEHATLSAAEKSAKDRSSRAAARAAALGKEQAELEARLLVLAGEIARSTERLAELTHAQNELRTALDAMKERLKTERENVRIAEASTRAARERREKAKDAAVEVDVRLGVVRNAVETLTTEAEERHDLSLAGLLDRLERDSQLLLPGYEPGALPEGVEAEAVPVLRLTLAELTAPRPVTVQSLRDAVQRLGPVNIAAEEEYRDAAAAHTEIEKQRADLAEALDTIEKALQRLNKTCRDKFKETFDAVNQRFREIYPRLVGGGHARLELVGSDDVLDCGVDVTVQPPGKRVQSLTLLSGGEKAMAAIALIFALFQVRPSPFCILDEVDAPLDDANGGRYNEMLKEMAQHSQFLVVTHNKKTMECADTLYGVTMPDPGISRLVAVRIE